MLNDDVVKTAKPKNKKYKITDSHALYLLISPNGGKYWRYDYRFYGKRRSYAIGVYPNISLEDARIERDKARRLIKDGVDPVQHRKIARLQQQADFAEDRVGSHIQALEDWLKQVAFEEKRVRSQIKNLKKLLRKRQKLAKSPQ